MKILWLSHLIPYPPKGGVLQRSYHLLHELAKYHEVDLLAFNQRELIGPLFPSLQEGIAEAHQALNVFTARHQFLEIPAERRKGGKHLLALRSLVAAPYNINWLKSKKFGEAILEYSRAKSYDLVHFDTISLVPFLKCVPADIAKVLDHHNIESHMLFRRAKNESNPLKKIYFLYEAIRLKKYEERYCPQFNLNITCSDIDTERLREITPGSKVETIPNGVDLEYFKPSSAPTQQPHRLIFAGTMSWYPNIEAVLYIANNLWDDLRKQFPTLEIDIVGANPSDRIKSLEYTHPGFKIHGFVNDVRPYLNNATIYLCPIKDGGGTKLKILDAMAMKKAIVSHPIACEGIPAEAEKNVLFAETAQQYITQIGKLLNNEKLRDNLGTEARRLIEREFSYSSIGKKLSVSYQNCAER